MNMIKIGIIVADYDEYTSLREGVKEFSCVPYILWGREGHRFFIKTSNGTAEVISVLCGIGKVNAAAAAAHLEAIGCNVILNYGLSGGISGVSRGDYCIPNRFLEHDFDLMGIGYKLCEKPRQEYIYSANEVLINLLLEICPNAKLGTAVTGDRFVCDSNLRNTLKNEFGAVSCDMETAAIAYVCSFSGVPFLSLRKISDDAGDDAVDTYKEMNNNSQIGLFDCIIKLIQKIIVSNFGGRINE